MNFNKKFIVIQITKNLQKILSLKDLSLSTYFDYIEAEINDNERKILDLIESYQKMKEDLLIE